MASVERIESVPAAPASDAWRPKPTWGVTPSSALSRGDRRFEAEAYLSDGYGLRLAIEARPEGWMPIGEMADVWQPSRLKGVVVSPQYGTPFLSAGQMFETKPTVRKWISADKTPQVADRYVSSGTILVTCSGNVGRVTMAHRPHVDHLITHDLLRVFPHSKRLVGWTYAYMRTAAFRGMATGSHYGHVVKHIEPSHLAAIPILSVSDATARRFEELVSNVFTLRDRAYDLVVDAERIYAEALGHDLTFPDIDTPFAVPVRRLASKRRRLEAFHYNQVADSILMSAGASEKLSQLVARIWWPNRFKRVFGENGTPYVSAEDLFNLNPPLTKRVYASLIDRREDYFLDESWLVMARSGQIYGLNGSVRLVGPRLTQFVVSEDLIRIAPRLDVIRPGYLLATLSHPDLGRPLVTRHAYGTSIPHLEPVDVSTIAIPRLDDATETAIADKMEEAARIRAQADDQEDKLTAEAELIVRNFLHGLTPVGAGPDT